MKKILSITITGCLLLSIINYKSFAQANTNLSNLTSPSKVNVALLPNADNSKSLGSASKSWKDLYLDGSVYLGGSRFISYASGPDLNNTGVGAAALNANTTGGYNSAFGFNAMYLNTTGGSNTATGYAALYSNTTGGINTANGVFALFANTTGGNNTAIGNYTLNLNTTGSYNLAGGSRALYHNTTGNYNVANGSYALYQNTTGSSNIAIGYTALNDNTTGYSNVAIGKNALRYNTEGHNLVAVGDSALYNQVKAISENFGYYNTAIGSKTLFANTNGYLNTATGHRGLYSNTTGHENMANGCYALTSNNSGYQNTASGCYALNSNTTGYENVATGYKALQANTTGVANIADGYEALFSNTSGYQNTAVGIAAMEHNTTGYLNTAFGGTAGSISDNNVRCTFLGYDADQTGANDYTNSMALGNNARITASSQVRIGDLLIQSVGASVDWTKVSDGRYKKEIKENVPGLQFINKLKAVTYHLDIRALRSFLKEDNEENNAADKSASNNNNDKVLLEKSIKEKESILYTGFIAQDVEKSAKESGYDFSGVDKPKNENSLYGLRYAEFVVPLVKAVQELSNENEKLKSQNNDLEQRLTKLETLVNVRQPISQTPHSASDISSASLEQNIPNPFNHVSTINYVLPKQYSSAKIIVTDKNGKTLKQINNLKGDKGMITVDAAILSSGVCQYALIVDGKIIDSKQMMIIK